VNNLSAGLVNASGNWWGTNTAAGVAAEVSANVDYSPWLDVGTDTLATPGFQGNFGTLHVDDTSPQAGATGRIQEAIDLATGATPTVIIEAGTYAESVAANKANLTLRGATGIPADVVIDAPAGNGITVTANNVTIQDLSISGAPANGISADGVSILTLSNLTILGNGTGGQLSNITTLNFTGTVGAVRDDITASGTSLQHTRDPLGANTINQALTLSGITNLNLFGDGGSDVFNITPATATTIDVTGGLPTPPALPGDTLNVN
jgi:hypothetical protein